MINGLPERLQMLRAKYGYSQKEVADKIYASASIVSGYETGERTPSTEALLSISRLYRCSTDYLLGRDTNETPRAVIDVEGLGEGEIQALRVLVDAMKESKNK